MPGYRFFVPVLPLVYLLFAEGLLRLKRFIRPFPAQLVIYGTIIALVLFNFYNWYEGHKLWRRNPQEAQEIAGRKLAVIAPAKAKVALLDAGAIPYFSGLWTTDILGAVDRHIAHLKPHKATHKGVLHLIRSDPQYVLDQQPDYVQLNAEVGDSPDSFSPIIGVYSEEMYRHPEFQKHYRPLFRQGEIVMFNRVKVD